jgi:hypothetical protein
MTISYKYTISSVDVDARAMEIIFEAEGHQTMHVGARLPYEGESLESLVAMYAPIGIWEALSRPIVPPEAGTTGVIVPQPLVPAVIPDPTTMFGDVVESTTHEV